MFAIWAVSVSDQIMVPGCRWSLPSFRPCTAHAPQLPPTRAMPEAAAERQVPSLLMNPHTVVAVTAQHLCHRMRCSLQAQRAIRAFTPHHQMFCRT